MAHNFDPWWVVVPFVFFRREAAAPPTTKFYWGLLIIVNRKWRDNSFKMVALDILVSISKIQFQSCLAIVPKMEGFDLMLGKDWLDMINPLVN